MKIWIKLLFFLIVFTSLVLAHRVNIFAYRQKGQIVGESYFADGSPCKKCKIELYDDKGLKIAETQTDEHGKFVLTTEKVGELKVVVEAGEGHRAEHKLEALHSEKKLEKLKKTSVFEEKKGEKKVGLEEVSILKQTVEEAIDNKLQEFKAEILLEVKKERNKIYLRDILGGIGYILGVWGLFAILKNRKKIST